MPLSRVAGLTVSLVAGAAVMGIVSEVEKPQVQLSIKPPQNAIAFIAELPRAQRDRCYISGEALAMEARARAIKPCSTVLAGAQPAVAQAGNFLKGMFGIGDIGGANGRGGGGDHGRAGAGFHDKLLLDGHRTREFRSGQPRSAGRHLRDLAAAIQRRQRLVDDGEPWQPDRQSHGSRARVLPGRCQAPAVNC